MPFVFREQYVPEMRMDDGHMSVPPLVSGFRQPLEQGLDQRVLVKNEVQVHPVSMAVRPCLMKTGVIVVMVPVSPAVVLGRGVQEGEVADGTVVDVTLMKVFVVVVLECKGGFMSVDARQQQCRDQQHRQSPFSKPCRFHPPHPEILNS